MVLTKGKKTYHGSNGLTRLEIMSCVLLFLSLNNATSLPYKICLGQVGLKGEAVNLVSPNGPSAVDWTQMSLATHAQRPLTWYKVRGFRNLFQKLCKKVALLLIRR